VTLDPVPSRDPGRPGADAGARDECALRPARTPTYGVSAASAEVATNIDQKPTQLPQGVGLSVAIALGQDAAAAVSGSPPAVILAATLLSGLLGLVAYQLRQARAGQDRTEMLLAQLADARDEQTRAAAIAERGRIATELHDVLAQSLSAAAIQLQGARILAVREGAGSRLSTAIDRASQLVNDGLGNARQAVGALRGEQLPTVTQLRPLIDGFRKDMHLDVTLRIEGHAHDLPPDTGLALYRGAQEALTNVARYAPGAAAQVVLCYHRDRTTLSLSNATVKTHVNHIFTKTGSRDRAQAVRYAYLHGLT
jgi:signal transduction histidine kinase